MRRRVGQHKWDGLAAGHGEFADRGHVLAADMHGTLQHHHVGPGNSAQRAALDARHPRHNGAIAEPDHELGVHSDLAALADRKANDGRVRGLHRHEIDQRHRALRRLEMGLEDERVRPVSAGDLGFVARRQQPTAVFRRAEQRRKARFRIETRPAQPIDRARTRHERSASAIADQRIVFDLGRHDAGARSGKIDDDLDVARLVGERLRPLLDRHAARDQAGEPTLVGALKR